MSRVRFERVGAWMYLAVFVACVAYASYGVAVYEAPWGAKALWWVIVACGPPAVLGWSLGIVNWIWKRRSGR